MIASDKRGVGAGCGHSDDRLGRYAFEIIARPLASILGDERRSTRGHRLHDRRMRLRQHLLRRLLVLLHHLAYYRVVWVLLLLLATMVEMGA